MISDALLIFLPLRTLRGLRNQPRLRRRLQAIFAASALTTCASIVSGAFNLSKIAFGYIVVVEIEVSHVLSFSFPFEFAASLRSGQAILLTSSTLFTDRAGSPLWSATLQSSSAPSSNSPTRWYRLMALGAVGQLTAIKLEFDKPKCEADASVDPQPEIDWLS